MRHLAPLMLLLLAACANGPFAGLRRDPPVETVAAPPPASPVTGVPVPVAGATTAAALDTTTEADKAAALAPPPAPAGERSLGTTAVALGNPAEPGFWLRSSLVTAPGAGRVAVAGGASIAVDLIPGTGSAQLSLPAFRALNLPLTALPEVTIFAR
ncbi:MAG: hypothetical protein ACT4OK_03700 [Gemmobacter sp.]